MKVCEFEDCKRVLGFNNRTGRCREHRLQVNNSVAEVGSPKYLAEQFVSAWELGDLGRKLDAQPREALVSRIADLLDDQGLRAPTVAYEGLASTRLREGIVLLGTPREASREAWNDPDLRSPTCPAYTKCLAYVVRKGWDQWTCRGCDGPGVQEARCESSAKTNATRYTRPEPGEESLK